MDVGDDGHPEPSTPEAPSNPTVDLSTPRLLQPTRDAPAASNAFQTLGFVLEMIKKPYSTSRHGLPPETILTLVQHNSRGGWDVFLSLFSSLTEGSPADVVL